MTLGLNCTPCNSLLSNLSSTSAGPAEWGCQRAGIQPGRWGLRLHAEINFLHNKTLRIENLDSTLRSILGRYKKMPGLSYTELSKQVYLASFAAIIAKVGLVSDLQIVISWKELKMLGVSLILIFEKLWTLLLQTTRITVLNFI